VRKVKETSLELLEPEDIDLAGSWLFWAREPDQRLIASLSGLGQTTPVIVERGTRPLSLIAGHARVRALKDLSRPVLAVSADANPTEKGLLYLASNTGRPLTSGMRLQALRYFERLLPEEDLGSVVGPYLGLSPHEREWELLCKWLRLPRALDAYLIQGNLPLETALILARLGPLELEALSPFFSDLRWSKSNAVNLFTWLWEAGQARSCGLDQLLEPEGFTEILNQNLSPKDAMARLSAKARGLRYPTLSRLEEDFAEASRGLSAGTAWEVAPSKNFEARAVTLSARIKDRDQLIKAVQDLENMAKSGVWETLWET